MRIRVHTAAILVFTFCLLTGCGAKDSGHEKEPVSQEEGTMQENTVTPGDDTKSEQPEEAAGSSDTVLDVADRVFEAEDGTFTGHVKKEDSKKGFSGTGYVSGFEEDEDSCIITVEAEKEGFYDLVFSTASMGGRKENHVSVDGERIGTIVTEQTSFSASTMERIYLTAGKHEVAISKYWGWILVDSVTLTAAKALPADLYRVSAQLVNPNATENTRRLMKYMTDIYGKQILSGQYCDGGMYGMERAAIFRTTGEYPAILGLDLIEYSPSRVAHGSTSKSVEYAIDYWEAGGIVSMAWHWNAPEKYLTGTWYRGFYKEDTNIDLAKIMNGEDTEGYELLLADIDAIAVQLKRLQDAGVPILWRPLHEASGGWFWWGNAGADAYKKLYVLMYDRLTNVHGLNNLIWLWNGQSADWYPGDEYVDIIGEDIYPGERVYTSQIKKYLEAAGYTAERKMIVLSENGCLFDPELAVRDGAMWGHFATWGGEFVLKNAKFNVLSEKYTDAEMVKKVYSHPAVISLSDLPDLKNYPVE